MNLLNGTNCIRTVDLDMKSFHFVPHYHDNVMDSIYYASGRQYVAMNLCARVSSVAMAIG